MATPQRLAQRESSLHFCLLNLLSLISSVNSRYYHPAPRTGHQTILVGSNMYMWAGVIDGLPEVHNNQQKKQFISCVEVFHSESGNWIHQPTSGAPPLGVSGYACTAVGDTLHYFGGWCCHDCCYHNSIHSLSTSSLYWVELSPTTLKGGVPMRKAHCGMVAFRTDGEEDILYIVAGYGPGLSYHQPRAQYEAAGDGVMCNEQHMFSLNTSESVITCKCWNSLPGSAYSCYHEYALYHCYHDRKRMQTENCISEPQWCAMKSLKFVQIT